MVLAEGLQIRVTNCARVLVVFPATTNGMFELFIDYYPEEADFWVSSNARHCFRN